MLRSRNELRSSIGRLEAFIARMHDQYPADSDFFQHTDGIFSDVLSHVVQEDQDWVIDLVDAVCTRHGMPYPAH
ncbi:hypothetical protein [Dyella sp. ASV21]|jgi:hypothetical protein|uniref:hypothetical protein n=1 Tax=Dyella sp. ASV21 TaxID=2795114 RepID=UPI0018ED542D|nr:hypothetical protein [Dyella sp. ASV21]